MAGAAATVIRIVQPEAGQRASLRALLARLRLPVEEYGSAADLLAACDAESRGCVVTEVDLPGTCGFALHEKLRVVAPRLPVVMLARRADVGLAVRALRTGAADFFETPLDEREFLERVRDLLEAAASGDDAA